MYNPVTKDTLIIRTIGGSHMVHAIGCPVIKNWTMEGCESIETFRPEKENLCPVCKKMLLTYCGASDYRKHRREYDEMYARYKIPVYRIQDFFQKGRAKTELLNDILYVRSKDQKWKIDMTDPENPKLFHANYQDDGESQVSQKGYHEHPSEKSTPESKFANFLAQITFYRYEDAREVHKKRKEKTRVTFSDLDPEYYGFKS